MKIKSFYAESMEAALQSASREMGEEALILNTRDTPAEFRHFGRFEVVCAVADEPMQSLVAEEPAPKVQGSKGSPRIVFFVGPSGSGKSVSCAKVAIHSKLNEGRSPAVLSWDCGRVGGAEGLRSFCEIADLPFAAIESREHLLARLDEMGEADLVLIDTPAREGAGAYEDEILASIHSIVAAEVHLVLSSTSSTDYLAACGKAYEVYRPKFLLPTHLDEARMDLSASLTDSLRSLPIRWCGIGRSVPEDLHDASKMLASPTEPVFAPPEPLPPKDRADARAAMEALLSRLRGPARDGKTGSRSAA